jgi:hypothetical protein
MRRFIATQQSRWHRQPGNLEGKPRSAKEQVGKAEGPERMEADPFRQSISLELVWLSAAWRQQCRSSCLSKLIFAKK